MIEYIVTKCVGWVRSAFNGPGREKWLGASPTEMIQ